MMPAEKPAGKMLRECLRDAPTDPAAEQLLRSIIENCARIAPLRDLLEIGEGVMAIYKRLDREKLNEN